LLVNQLKQWGLDKALIIVEAQDEKLFLAARNLPYVEVIEASGLNPLALAAYTVTGGSPAVLPPGFAQTAQIQADGVALGAMTKPHPAVEAMIKNSNVFGLMGQNAATRTAFVSFRGTQDLSDWLQDLDVVPEDYAPIGGFGQVPLVPQSRLAPR